jgi:hypothetical protein
MVNRLSVRGIGCAHGLRLGYFADIGLLHLLHLLQMQQLYRFGLAEVVSAAY